LLRYFPDLSSSNVISRGAPPCSCCFPYTTLFRSRRSFKGFAGTQLEFRSFEVRGLALYRPAAKQCSNNILQREHRSSKGFAGTQDRKSTRLNSSHVSISYAVFCLKKKIIESVV